jgi:hypothetical protein
MAIALVQDFQVENAFSDTVLAVPAGGVAVGNTLILSIAFGSDGNTVSSVTDTKGNSYSVRQTQAGSGDNRAIVVVSGYMTSALTSSDTITIDDANSDGCYVNASEFSGLAPSSFDKSASQRVNFDSSHTSGPTSAIAQDEELLLGAHMVASSTDAWTATDAFSVSQTDTIFGASSRMVTQYKIVAAIAAYASTGTTTGSNTTLNAITTYKADTGLAVGNIAWIRAMAKEGLQDVKQEWRRRRGIYVPDAPALLLAA